MNDVQGTSCTACGATVLPVKQSPKSSYSSVLGLLIFLLPKCPFCVVAYTSSMAICGAPTLVDHHTDWGAWLAIGLSLLCLGSIVRNYRGTGTWTALGIALFGFASVITGLFLPNAMVWYYLGGAMLFVGSFYNGRGYRWLSKIV